MRNSRIIPLMFIVFLISILAGNASAGSSVDYGDLPGTPAIGQVNWAAWLNKDIQAGGYPSEVMTEDSTNSGNGVDQGYQDFGGAPNPNWILQVASFSNSPGNGDDVTILLGGLGASSGSGWRDSFTWDTGVPFTDQGTATVEGSFNACPTMLQGSQTATEKTVLWSGTSSEHLVYRSTQASGAGNDASNGRYQYVATVAAGTYSYSDAACGTGDPTPNCWHIVIPSDGSGVINGCHSEESNPTAITLSKFQIADAATAYWLIPVGLSLLAAVAISVILLRKRSQAR